LTKLLAVSGERFGFIRERPAGDGVEVCHIIDLVGRGKPDEAWIPEVAKIGATVVTQDSNIRRTPHLRQMCADYRLGMIFFMSPRSSPYTY